MKLVSFYADRPDSNKYYENASKHFRIKCKELNLDYYVDELKFDGMDYWQITRQKPQFILQCLERFKETVVWVDIDDTIIAKPEHLDCDIGFQIFPKDYHHKRSRGKIAASGVSFNYTEKSIIFLKEWVARCENYKGKPKGDHDIIFGVIKDVDFKKAYYRNNFVVHGQSEGRDK